MQQEQPQTRTSERPSSLRWIGFVAQSFAVSIEVFLHRGFGERYLGNAVVGALALMAGFGLFVSGDLEALMIFAGFFLFAVVCARGDSRRRRRRGEIEHSYYNGSPLLMRLPIISRLREETIKSQVEPAVAFVIGALLMPVSEAVGGYLMCASFGLLVWSVLTREQLRVRVMNMRDAYIAQRQVTERFRDGGWR